MKNVIIHHSADLDGLSSGNSVKHFLIGDCHLVGWDYKDSLDPVKEVLKLHDEGKVSTIAITDISFPAELMLEFKKRGAIWIDHHKTAIDDSEANGYADMSGLRRDGTAACALVWEYYGFKVPRSIELLGKYDVFGKDEEWDTHTIPFQEYMKANRSVVWEDVFEWDANEIQARCDQGVKISEKKRYRNKQERLFCGTIEFEGFKFVTKRAMGSSLNFDWMTESEELEFDGMLTYAYLSDLDIWKVSLYGYDHSPDLSKIAKKFGGGGHKRACGFQVDTENMQKILDWSL